MQNDDKPLGRRPGPAAMPTRRLALGAMGTAVAAVGVAAAATPALAQSQAAPATFKLPDPPPLKTPRADLVNVIQYEDQARLVIGETRLAPVAGSDRTVTDRITLRPRINIPTGDMDLTCPLFGDNHFTPIIVGPMADQKRFHPEGEVALARGASAGKAGMIISAESSMPLADIAKAATTPLWVQVYAKSPKTKAVLDQARAVGAKAVVVTVNAGPAGGAAAAAAPIDWAAVEAVIKGTSLPVLVKGITRPEDARQAVARGAKGIIVSNYRGGSNASLPGTLLLIEPVVKAVDGRVPVLVDGSFRYGSDVLKALGLGAKAVLIGRPVSWGLAAYGADGVQGVVETLQTDLARIMGMCGRLNLAAIDPTLVRVHAPLPKAAS